MKRIRWIAMAVGVVSPIACADVSPTRLTTVEIAATPCDRPTARLGVGTILAEGLVLTAAHVVEDDLRHLAVDGHPASVIALDARIDAAVLALDTTVATTAIATTTITTMVRRGSAAMSDMVAADAVRIVTPTRVIDTTVERIVELSVDDATDGVTHRRRALVLDGVVPGGTSGAPVVDSDGRIVAMVNISHTRRDVTYATRTSELQMLIDDALSRFDGGLDSVTRRSLAAQERCA